MIINKKDWTVGIVGHFYFLFLFQTLQIYQSKTEQDSVFPSIIATQQKLVALAVQSRAQI